MVVGGVVVERRLRVFIGQNYGWLPRKELELDGLKNSINGGFDESTYFGN